MDYPEFVWLLNKSRLVLTDSGGVQEEAPILGKPVLLIRELTERPEGVGAGVVKVIGTGEDAIVRATSQLLSNTDAYKQMSQRVSLLGDGTTARQIVTTIGEGQALTTR
jgi:UDP-N-acetylglucosamine 2-epimerase (non-hydrolysing)